MRFLRPNAVVLLAVLGWLVAPARALNADEEAPDVRPAALSSAAAAVVRVESTVPLEGAPVRMPADEATFSNTGFFVGTSGEVLTSVLGVAGCRQITVVDVDGRRASARVLAFDQPSGLALLHTGLAGTEPFELAPGCPPAGSPVAVASAAVEGGTARPVLAEGVVAEGCAPVRVHGLEWRDLILASAPPEPGSAAAPVLDAEGRLLGVLLGCSAGPAGGPVPTGCYILPVAKMQPILDRLHAGETRRLGWLGVAVVANPEGGHGVLVVETVNGAPAARAGLRRGDILLELGDRPIDDPAVLAEYVTEAGPGRDISLLVQRGGDRETTIATVAPRPLLICGGMGRPGGKVVRLRLRRTLGAIRLPGSADGSEEVMFELLDENEDLRNRVRELEKELELLRAENET
jgi:S1-C subfamily serine protease